VVSILTKKINYVQRRCICTRPKMEHGKALKECGISRVHLQILHMCPYP